VTYNNPPKRPERLDKEEHAAIVNAVACSYCGAPPTEPCHWVGYENRKHAYPDMVHRSRTTAFQGGQA
jgi:hypothetical protein